MHLSMSPVCCCSAARKYRMVQPSLSSTWASGIGLAAISLVICSVTSRIFSFSRASRLTASPACSSCRSASWYSVETLSGQSGCLMMCPCSGRTSLARGVGRSRANATALWADSCGTHSRAAQVSRRSSCSQWAWFQYTRSSLDLASAESWVNASCLSSWSCAGIITICRHCFSSWES